MQFGLGDTDARWVWPAEHRGEINQYMEFRHEFVLDQPIRQAQLVISADSDYTVWINGEFVDCGQYSDYPDKKTYDRLTLVNGLRPGTNVLAVLVYYQGQDTSTYVHGRPRLLYSLKGGPDNIVSGRETHYRKSPSYSSGPMPLITGQLSFTFEYDARGDDGWISPDYEPQDGWRQIQPQDILADEPTATLSPRPIKKLQIEKKIPVDVVAQGVFRRADNENGTVAQQMQKDFLSSRTWNEISKNTSANALPSDAGIELDPECFDENDGVYLVVDLGREEAGLVELDVDTQAGTIIDIAYGEHLDDLRVRAAVGRRNFAHRYISRDGRQRFTHYFTRFAGRYVELHITGKPGKFVLYYVGLRPQVYPVEIAGSFNSPDGLDNRIYETAVRTLTLCMHEHYEDCPWREQALYANDSRNQALCGYYCFGDYDFPRTSFSLLGEGLNDDGYLELCAPAKVRITIPSFSMVWILAVADYFLYSGDGVFVSDAMTKIRTMMDVHLQRLSDHLLPCPQGERYWQFYDWADGLDGTLGECTAFGKLDEMRFDAPLNLFFCWALDAAAALAETSGDRNLAETYKSHAQGIRNVFHDRFWDRQEGAYRTYSGHGAPKHFAELTQALAICARACPNELASKLRERLACEQNGLVGTSLSQTLYKFEALMTEKDKFGRWVFDKISRDWGYMLFNGATSFWETLKGARDFNNAGSLCHGWSAIPVYFYHAYLLGIRPIEPGFRTFIVDPVKGVVHTVSGQVPTPFGPVTLKWEEVESKTTYHLSHPDQTNPETSHLEPQDHLISTAATIESPRR